MVPTVLLKSIWTCWLDIDEIMVQKCGQIDFRLRTQDIKLLLIGKLFYLGWTDGSLFYIKKINKVEVSSFKSINYKWAVGMHLSFSAFRTLTFNFTKNLFLGLTFYLFFTGVFTPIQNMKCSKRWLKSYKGYYTLLIVIPFGLSWSLTELGLYFVISLLSFTVFYGICTYLHSRNIKKAWEIEGCLEMAFCLALCLKDGTLCLAHWYRHSLAQ